MEEKQNVRGNLVSRVVKVSDLLRRITLWSERILAVSILSGMAIFFYSSVATMSGENWGDVNTIYELINRILLLVICLELIRTLLTHELEAVLELLAFVVARKTMKPDLTVIDILLCSISFVGLLAARKYLGCGYTYPMNEPETSDNNVSIQADSSIQANS